MWTPAPMARLFLVTLDRDLPQATEVLGRASAVQLLPVAELGPWAEQLGWQEATALAAQYGGYRRRIAALLQALALGPTPTPAPAAVAPQEVAARAERRLSEIEGEVEPIAAQRLRLQEEGKRLALAAQQLQLLARLPVDLAELRRLEFLYFVAALVPQEHLERLRGSLAGVPSVLTAVARRERDVLVFAFAGRAHAETLERALQSAYAQRADIPPDLTGTPAEALREVQAQEAALLQEEAALQRATAALAAQHRDELWRLDREVATNAAAIDAWEHAGSTARTRLVAGWAPAAALPRLQARLAEALQGRLAVDVAPPPPPARDGPPVRPQPPTQLRNPPPARPFEALVTTYGVPRYHEIDPTPVAGLLFVVMFGAMFGDLGQGAIIAAAGWLLTREIALKGSRAFGWILLAAGASAMIFGLLYGTVFLIEGAIPALWFRPLSNPTYTIQVAVVFGVAVVSLSIALHMVNALRAGDRVRLLLDRRGLLGLWFYWGAAYAAFGALSGRPLGTAALVALIGLPLLLMAFLEPFGGLFRGARRPGSQAIVVSVVETFDAAVRYVSNTVSFIRLAAFAIAHVGIGIMVLILAGLVRVPGAGAAIIILGNAFVIALEGLVVFVQALRLDYYEFFTRFLQADGVPFRPFALPGTPAPLAGGNAAQWAQRSLSESIVRLGLPPPARAATWPGSCESPRPRQRRGPDHEARKGPMP